MLFERYLSDVKQRNLKVSLWDSKVMFVSHGSTETVTLGFWKMLTAEAPESLWEHSLKGRKAEVSADLLAQADASGWDVICAAPVPVQQSRSDPPGIQSSTLPNGGHATSTEAVIYFKSGMQYAGRSDYTNALKEFKVVERIDPKFPDLQMNIGVAYMQLKDFVKASDYMTRGIEQSPRSPQGRYNMACLQAKLGQADDAITSLIAARDNGLQLTASMRNSPEFALLRGRHDFDDLFRKGKER
jgi:tetratricopeptide (TPR) repeat protein